MAPFRKILIANRGEIARRIMRTCRRMGIKTVAVYSEADTRAPFVREADEAVCVGPPQVSKSYLNGEKIMEVAKQTQAEAIHPGYGFLAENANFARRCAQEGIVFIGPTAEVIERMGSKIEARHEMQRAGVPVVPGWDGRVQSLEEAKAIARRLGYPVMLKASAGGGGIGMHLVHSEDELEKAFAATAKQAESYFGDGTIFFEKFIPNARHIEVQVAGDIHGQVVHLFERECSIQRRHQKVIEESPSPFLDEVTREKLLATAVRGAKQIGYTNVGTMEFIFDEQRQFYFLEMNTRLQVEHPVTEEITGMDLVEWQIRLAAKEPLPCRQEAITRQGHAIECRLYAEDPDTFFPSPGVLKTLSLPQGDVRLDFGVEEGDTVSPYYDAMIGKIITYGRDRDEAIGKMKAALAQLRVEGITTNQPLLEKVLSHPDFRRGVYTTSFLNR